ncbi:MAG: hypothetical protein AAF267_00705 [Deinococcota bacterium]
MTAMVMTRIHPTLQLTETLSLYKTRASLLLKGLRSDDPERARTAALRLGKLPQFANLIPQALATQETRVQHKHALNVIALEQGYADWAALKHVLEQDCINSLQATWLYPPQCHGFLNEWHAHYEVAKAAHVRVGGYLLTYKRHYFVCTQDYIQTLGLDPDDADWAQLGWDWANPADEATKRRLERKLLKVLLAKVQVQKVSPQKVSL